MLFNSYEFIFVFLPLAVLVTLLLSSIGQRSVAKLTLFALSLGFYAWWNATFLVLLGALLVFNFGVGTVLLKQRAAGKEPSRALFVFGIVGNLGTLVFFKYTMFLAQTAVELFQVPIAVPEILLPLGLSFMVFQKIAFLVDVYSGEVSGVSFLDYCLFVTFFPQLIAGPIVHHGEIIPQFEQEKSLRFDAALFAKGVAFFVVGLAKKAIIADALAPTASALFSASPESIGIGGAWLGAVTYCLQLYFDFSGYSDMAVGLGLMFGVELPINFDSPLKASSIIDFWQRWHMSLTRFLNAYLFNPISLRIARKRAEAGKRSRGRMSVEAFAWQMAWPTMVTMFLAGIWHGAGFQFLIFGVFHGVLLVGNHALRVFWRKPDPTIRWRVLSGRVVTFSAVVISLVFFRSETLSSALHIIGTMFNVFGVGQVSAGYPLGAAVGAKLFIKIAAAFAIAQWLPNTHQLFGAIEVGADRSWLERLKLRPGLAFGAVLGLIGFWALTALSRPAEFLYFRF